MFTTAPATISSCDLFCKVIDNFGDIGVCWRLARQLADEHGLQVRLWLDDLAPLARLAPALQPALTEQQLEGVSICAWHLAEQAHDAADLVIEAFACDPPAAYLGTMARRARAPVWLNLEYLSAEDWVADCHGLSSPHPSLPLKKHFFFPGFDARTGGLIREAALDHERQALLASPAAQAAFWQHLGCPPPRAQALSVSLFAYENAALPELLSCWAAGPALIDCMIPEGRVLPQVSAWAGHPLQAGACIQTGALRLTILPFMAQTDYDRLLALCALNFVRGEDSFVRAQWARRPMVWHIYQQADQAHRAKLDAFLQRYGKALSPASQQALTGFSHAWDAQCGVAQHWPALQAALPEWAAQAPLWAEFLAKQTNLAANLLIFSKNLLECPAL